MVHCLFCQTPVPFEVPDKESHTSLERSEDLKDFQFWVNFKEVVLCYVDVVYDVYQFLSYKSAIFRFPISTVLIRSEITLDPGV